MFCRVCLRKNMQVQYKLNIHYINFMETITGVKMKINDIVCCFCITTLRKIQKFINTVKDVDSILKLVSIKTEEDDNETNLLYNLSVSTTRNISFACSMYETYASNIREELEKKAVKDSLKVPEIKDEPEENNIDSETNSEYYVPLIAKLYNEQEQKGYTNKKDEPEENDIDSENNSEDDVPLKAKLYNEQEQKGCTEKKVQGIFSDSATVWSTRNAEVIVGHRALLVTDEPRQVSCSGTLWYTHTDNETDSEDVPLLPLTDARKKNNKILDESTKNNDAGFAKHLRRTSGEEDNKFVTELSSGKIVNLNKTKNKKRGNRLGENDKLQKKIKAINANRISELNDVHTICTSAKPSSRDILSYICSQKGNLTKRLRTHTGIKLLSCNFCSYKFSKIGSLTSHLRTHTGEKPFSCDICSYKCSQKGNLKCHLRIHTGEKPFSCNICSRKFSQLCHLRNHLRTHTGEKPFSCNICSRKFSQLCHLTNHLRTHTGEKPFSCTICSYKFIQIGNLTKHLKTHKIKQS